MYKNTTSPEITILSRSCCSAVLDFVIDKNSLRIAGRKGSG